MSVLMRAAVALIAVLALVPLARSQDDAENCKDYPGINRMPGYYIRECGESQFDSYQFNVTEGKTEKTTEVEGHKYTYRYQPKDDVTAASALQIVRNFQNAVRAAGGQTLWEFAEDNRRETTLRFSKGSTETWIYVDAYSSADKLYMLTIIERQAMQQDVAVTAAAIGSGLAANGSFAIYGIQFDTAKSDLKPESKPALDEIAKLLNQRPGLKILVVGHTDMVGELASNMKLSQARAQAVVAALTGQYHIAAARLTAFGNGPYAPVATNKTEEGRAKNRRVELVEWATQ
jgi:outer membrane protein OmpA-like peptidoglycan-associated protein